MIWKEGKVLLGKRKGNLGTDEYSFPGGHLEPGESLVECALREISEECGVLVRNVRFQLLASVFEFLPKHYVQVGFLADWEAGEPKVLEPDKCAGWGWYSLDALPVPLFFPTAQMIASYKSGANFIDVK